MEHRLKRVLARGRAVLKQFADETDGVWRTVRGRKVFIKKGESVEDAMKRSLHPEATDKSSAGGAKPDREKVRDFLKQQGQLLSPRMRMPGLKVTAIPQGIEIEWVHGMKIKPERAQAALSAAESALNKGGYKTERTERSIVVKEQQ